MTLVLPASSNRIAAALVAVRWPHLAQCSTAGRAGQSLKRVKWDMPPKQAGAALLFIYMDYLPRGQPRLAPCGDRGHTHRASIPGVMARRVSLTLDMRVRKNG
jgi:hypothetical protein